MPIRNRFLLLTLFFLVSFPGFGQPGQLQFTHIDVNDGLSHNQVNCILKDNKGFVWLGTMSGLNRYDGYSFKVYRHDMNDSTSLSDNYIRSVFKLPFDKLWINTRNGSDVYNPAAENFDRNTNAYLQSMHLPAAQPVTVLNKDHLFWFLYGQTDAYIYDEHLKKTVCIHRVQAQANETNALSDARLDASGNIWMILSNGSILLMDGKTGNVISRIDTLSQLNKSAQQQYQLFADSENGLWAYVGGGDFGVYYFDPVYRRLQHFSKDAGKARLNNDVIYGIIEDEKGTIWIGTDHGGINVLNKNDFSVRYLTHNPEDPNSIAQNVIYSLYKDNTGIIWAGTFKKGISYYNEAFDRFPLFRHDPNNVHSMPYEDVNRFVEDKRGNLWIGTNGGGLIYFDRKNNTYRQFLHSKSDPNTILSNVVVGLYLGNDGKLWIGTYMGGLDCYDGKKFVHYQHKNGDNGSLGNNSVWDIFEDSRQNLWVATLGGGVEKFDRATGRFTSLFTNVASPLSYVSAIAEDRDSNLWFGTSGGIAMMNLRQPEVIYLNHIAGNASSLSNDNINSIYPDSRGWVWVGTREGLNYYDPATKKFKSFYIADGLPDNTILTILEDNDHRMWVGTANGLSRLTIHNEAGKTKFTFSNYDESDGLQGREFNDKSALRLRDGSLIFGGANGFNLFDPATIRINKYVPPLVFTDLQVFNKSVSIGETVKKHVILRQSISETKSITLPYSANDFSIVFAALGFDHPDKNQSGGAQRRYAYKLEGFNKGWIYANSNAHSATYTNLNPGKYLLRVKAANSDGYWGAGERTMEVIVLPPFWRSIWAYIIYALLVIAILYTARSILLYRTKMKYQMLHQQHEAQRLHELDMMKIRFFTNISHEFRTPITLVLAPLQRLITDVGQGPLKTQLQLMERNAKRLLHLVNQLLDFRKLEVEEIRLNPIEGDIVEFTKEVIYSFTDIADKKNIHFTFETTEDHFSTTYDSNKLERILFNLLSNAFKFTPENGSVKVSLDLYKGYAEGRDLKSWFRIRVKDNGIGIPSEKQSAIFERFFQHDTSSYVVNPGSGIGLSITREFVRLHGGIISVKSEPGKSTCFTVLIPASATPLQSKGKSTVPTVLSIPLQKEAKEEAGVKLKRKKYTLLLVEDNDDFRFYLKDNLSVYFNILEAADGKQGWQKASTESPDLVVSDIMMPEMNGVELSKRLKGDPRTARIPLILLTARGSEDQRLEGYRTGANDYIVKPFNFEILLARIRNLLTDKKNAEKAVAPKVVLQPAEPTSPSLDTQFLSDATGIVEKNMCNPNFSVEELSRGLFLSRVTVYKRILSLTGKTPMEFIRIIRLKRAAQLLEKGMHVSEAAYETGFNNPKYFTRYFKELFQRLPSEYIRERKMQRDTSSITGNSDS